NPQAKIRNPQSSDSLLACRKKRPQHRIERLIRANSDVIDLLRAAPGPNTLHKCLYLAPISDLQTPRLGNYVAQRFESLKHSHLLKWKINLGRITHVQYADRVPAV